MAPPDVDSYIAAAAAESRPILDELRAVIKATVPGVEEGISWGVPFYKHHGPLAGFAVYKHHVSFGVATGELRSAERKALEKAGYVTGKKTIRIRFDQDVPADSIRRILGAR
jgi:uncharacterized protein